MIYLNQNWKQIMRESETFINLLV